jgi:hypothetical protein
LPLAGNPEIRERFLVVHKKHYAHSMQSTSNNYL